MEKGIRHQPSPVGTTQGRTGSQDCCAHQPGPHLPDSATDHSGSGGDNGDDPFHHLPAANLIKFLLRPRVKAALSTIVILYVFLVVGWAITVSRQNVSFGIAIWTQPTWVAGQSAGWRVAVEEPSISRFLPGFQLEASLMESASGHPAVDGAGAADGGTDGAETLQPLPGGRVLTLSPPTVIRHLSHSATAHIPADIDPGRYLLQVRARRGREQDIARLPIMVVSPSEPDLPQRVEGSGRRWLVRSNPDDPDRRFENYSSAQRGGVRARAVAAGGGLAQSLTSEVFLRVVDSGDGTPINGPLHLHLESGISRPQTPNRIFLDNCGLAQFSVTPQSPELGFRVSPNEEETVPEGVETITLPGQGEGVRFRLSARATRIMARPYSPFLTVDEPLLIQLESLQDAVPVHTDLYQGGRWVASDVVTTQDSRGSITLAGLPDTFPQQLPTDGEGDSALSLGHLQVYSGFAAPGQGNFTQWILPVKGRQSNKVPRELQDLARSLRTPEDPLNSGLESCATNREEGERLAHYLLGQVPVQLYNPPLAMRSGIERIASLEARKARTMAIVRLALGALGALVIISLVYLLASGYHQIKRRYLETDHLEEYGVLSRRAGLGQFLLVLAALILAFIAILIMLSELRWGL